MQFQSHNCKFTINQKPGSFVLIGDNITSSMEDGVMTSYVPDGTISNGIRSFKVRGTVIKYPSGKVTVNGKEVDWNTL